MTEREQHETRTGGTSCGGDCRRVPRVAVFVVVALFACALTVSFGGTVAAQGDAASASATSFNQATTDSGELALNNTRAEDSSGTPTGKAVIVVTQQTGSFSTGFEHKVIGIDKNPGTLDGKDIKISVDESGLPGEGRINIFPESELNGGVLDGLSVGDVLTESTICSESEWCQFVKPELRSGDGFTTPAAPLDLYHLSDANANDKSVKSSNLGSVTLSGSPLANYEDKFSNSYKVIVSDRKLNRNEFDDLGAFDDIVDEPYVLDVNGDNSAGSVSSLTFDLSGEGLSGTQTLYVTVVSGKEVIRVGNDDVVDDSFTLTVEEPDLQVTNVVPQDSGVVEGDKLTVNATVENQGQAATNSQTVTFEVDANQDGSFTEVATQSVGVSAGSTKDLSFSYDTSVGDASAVDVRVTTEDDTEGMTETASIEKAAPDQITNGAASPDPIDPGETSTVTAELLDGDGNPLDGADVTFSHDGNGDLTVTQGTSDTNGEVEAEYTADIDDRGGTVTVTIQSVDDTTVTETVDIGVNDATLSLSLNAAEPVDPVTGGNANEVQLEAVLTGDGPIQGEPISFSVDTGNGVLSNADTQTDANGEATVTYTVGENDWDTDPVVSANIDGTTISDTTTFGVSEPDLTIDVTSAQSEIPPTGENDVTATVTYEAPFDNQEQENVGVTFGVVTGAGSLLNPDSQTDTNGEATVTYDPAEADFGQTVEVSGGIESEVGLETQGITTQAVSQDSTTFDVQEPVEVNATADLGVTAPGGVGVTFELRNPDIQDTQLSGTTSEGDGEVTVNFEQDGNGEVLPEGDYTVEVVGADGTYQTGVSDTVSVNAGNTGEVTLPLDGEDATVDVEAELGVTAPEDNFDVNVDIGVPGGTDVSETVTLQKGDGTLADSADSSTFSVGAIDHDQVYTVTVSADGYSDASATGYVEPGGSGVIDVGTLGANALDIEASSELGVPPGGGDTVDVTYTLEGPEGNEDVKTAVDVTDTSSVVFASVDALDAGEKYNVTADADGYEEKQVTTPGAPGNGTEGIDEEADIGVLDAEPAEVTAGAELEAEPGKVTTVTFRLFDESGVVDTQTDEVGPGETETDNVTLKADFSGDAGAGETYEVEAKATDGNENYTTDTEAAGELNPGDEATADGLFLEANPATVDALAELGAAPGENTTVSFRLLDETGTIVDNGTDEVGPDETVTDSVALKADFSEEGIDAEEYTVEAEVTDGNDNYTADTEAVGELNPGDEETADGLSLGADPATVTTDAELEAAPGENTTVKFELLDETGSVVDNETGVVGPGETETGAVTLTAEFSEDDTSTGNYTVSANVTEGNTAYGTNETDAGELAPGADAESTQELFLDADPAKVTAEAELGLEPNVETTVTFELINEAGEVIETETGDVNSSGTETGTVNLTADFSRDEVDSGPYTIAAGVTGGDDRYNDDETETGEVHPGDTVLVEDLLLGAVDCIDSRRVSRGQEDQECPSDRVIERGESRDGLDRETGRRSDTRRRDRSRGEGRNRGSGR